MSLTRPTTNEATGGGGWETIEPTLESVSPSNHLSQIMITVGEMRRVRMHIFYDSTIINCV
jgi:hypothetical protein